MPCPACGSNAIWDDNLAWGCVRCDWFTTGAVQNVGSPYDRFIDMNTGLPEKPLPLPEPRTDENGDEEGDWRPPPADDEESSNW